MRWPILFQLRPLDIGPADVRRIALVLFILLVAALGLLTALVFKEQRVGPQGERGEQGATGPQGPAGAAGPAGQAGVDTSSIRFVDGECRQPCLLACEIGERILTIHAINPGGTLTFEDEVRATFRPAQRTAVKVVIACVSK